MSMEAPFEDSGEESEIKFLSFNNGNAVVDDYHRELYFTGPVAEWVEERKSRFGEHLMPHYLYLTNPGAPGEHRVAWVYHTGLVEADGLEGYMSHHAVCDCAVDVEPASVPITPSDCPEMEVVLQERANYWSREYAIPQILGALTVYDEENGEFVLSPQGLDLAMSSLVGFLKLERQHPRKWFGNLVSGLMTPDTLAGLLHQTEEDILDMVKAMDERGHVEFDGEAVRLPQAA